MSQYQAAVSEQVRQQSIQDTVFDAIFNIHSGTLDAHELKARLIQYSDKIQVAQFHLLGKCEDLEQQVDQLVASAADNGRGILAAGGDGTINLVVKYAMRHNVPLAIIPSGTFNLLARHYNLTLDPAQQLEQLAECRLQKVPICFANDLPFTTSIAFGLYPEVIEDREHYQSQFGIRTRAAGYAAGLITFFKNRPRARYRLKEGSQVRHFKALLLMITHNKIHLENLGVKSELQQLDSKFAVVRINPSTWYDKLRLLFKGGIGALYKDEAVHIKYKRHITLSTGHKKLQCVLDGEVMEIETPIEILIKQQALSLFVPDPHLATERAK